MQDGGGLIVGEDKAAGGFWNSIPGIVTAIAGLITAIAALLGTLVAADLIGPGSTRATSSTSTSASPASERLRPPSFRAEAILAFIE